MAPEPLYEAASPEPGAGVARLIAGRWSFMPRVPAALVVTPTPRAELTAAPDPDG